MKREQTWIPDTHPNMKFIQEWDDQQDADNREHICTKVIVTDENGIDQIFTDADEIKKLHEDAVGLNVHKNTVIVPAMLAALSTSEKIKLKDTDGNDAGFDFKTAPEFRAQNGEIIAKMDHLPITMRDKLSKVMKAHSRPVKK